MKLAYLQILNTAGEFMDGDYTKEELARASTEGHAELFEEALKCVNEMIALGLLEF